MKKIMFNDKYGLTQAVLEGRKTQTRRIVNCPTTFGGKYVSGFRACTNNQGLQYSYLVDEDECEIEGSENNLSAYCVGEEIAIAQSYNTVIQGYNTVIQEIFSEGGKFKPAGLMLKSKGLYNKMFVRADLMPHRIKITNIRVERLQDISDEDCLKEGVGRCRESHVIGYPLGIPFNYYIIKDERGNRYTTPKEAFSSLIDKTCGKGTWESNPFVFVYDFKLIK